ncbi:SoxR-reducing system protein RseC, partial [Pantoea septica]
MMREWATVVAWRDGIATLHTEAKTSCNSCSARKGCGSHMLNKLGPKDAHVMEIASATPLHPGQRIELGIKESSLLGSALLVYMTPLFGLFLLAGLFQALFHSDLAAACGALLGGIGGFIVAKGVSL